MTDETDTHTGDGPGYLVWQVTNLWQKAMKDALAPFDLTPVQYLLLAGLNELGLAAEKDTAVKQSDLSRHCRTDVMMTSQVVRTLEKRGLVARARHEEDGRAVALRLTAPGSQAVTDAAPAVAEADASFFESLGDRVDEFADALTLLTGEKRRRRVKALGG